MSRKAKEVTKRVEKIGIYRRIIYLVSSKEIWIISRQGQKAMLGKINPYMYV